MGAEEQGAEEQIQVDEGNKHVGKQGGMSSSALINTSHSDLETFDFSFPKSVGLEDSGKTTDTGEEDVLSSEQALLEFRCFCPILSKK